MPPMSLAEARAELRGRAGSGEVQLRMDGPIARLVLRRPEAANALSGAMLLALEEAIEALEGAVDSADPLAGPVGLIVRGAGGRAFCAGSDLRLVRANLDQPALAAALSVFMHELTERLRALPLVSVAAIEGAAVGGGAELATACDYRVMSRAGFIRFVHARLGLSPGWAGGARLVALLGRRRALTLLTTARRLNAPLALDWGLVDRLADPGAAEAGAEALLAPTLRYAPASVRGMKRLVHAADTETLSAALTEERQVFEGLWGGPAKTRALSKGPT